MISDFGFEISDLPADSPVIKSEIVHPKSEIELNPKSYIRNPKFKCS